MGGRMTTSSDRLRVAYDTTVFCGALLSPDGGNMKALVAGAFPGVQPIIPDSVLTEFVRNALQGMGRPLKRYSHPECIQFLSGLDEIRSNVVPVGVRDVLASALRFPNRSLGELLQAAALQWPEGFRAAALFEQVKDPCDLHVCLACVEHNADVLVTSNLDHFDALLPFCAVEPPSKFLLRFDATDE